MKKTQKTSKKLLLGWSSMVAATTVISLLLTYTTFFATDYLGIPAATVGLLFMATKIFDGFTDLVAGYLIERTNSRWGKGRPYDLAIIGYGAFTILLFGAPKMGFNASCIYLFVMYTIIQSVFYTFLMCNESVYMANAIDNPSDSVNLSSAKGIVSMVVGIIAGVALPQIIKNVGTTRKGWLTIAVALMIPSIMIGLIRFAIVKEKRQSCAGQEKIGLKDLVKAISSNKYILLYSLIIFIVNIGYNSTVSASTYYAQYILGDIGVQSILSLANMSTIVLMVVMPVLSKKLGLMKTIKITVIVGMIGFLLRLAAPASLGVVFVSSLFSNWGFMAVITFGVAITVDCIDYGEWKTGKRNEGTIACVPSVTTKIGTAAGVAMVGLFMGMTGYNGTLAVQPDSANNMIIALSSIIPAVTCLVLLIVLHFFDLDKKMGDIRKELENKRKSIEE